MNKVLIIYSSRYGHTEKYARWLAEELAADICESNNLRADQLKDYLTIIFGSSLYAGRSKGATVLAQCFEQIKNKNVILFTVGMLDTNSEENIIGINRELNKVISPEIREKVKVFHVRGGIDSQNLSCLHKMMLKFVHSFLSRKPENKLTDSDRDILALYGKTVDFSDKRMLTPITLYCSQIVK